MTPAYATASTGQVSIDVARSYTTTGANGPVQGVALVSTTTTQISQGLAQLIGGSTTAALVYEAATGNVVGVSWPGDDLMDKSMYSATNPVIVLKTLANLQSNAGVRLAIDDFGNLPDGRVEAFFSGEMSALKQMLDWCESGPRMATVTNIEHEWRTDECQYSGFQIKG